MATTMGETLNRPNWPLSARTYWFIGLVALAIILVVGLVMNANRATTTAPSLGVPTSVEREVDVPNDTNQNTTRDVTQPTGDTSP